MSRYFHLITSITRTLLLLLLSLNLLTLTMTPCTSSLVINDLNQNALNLKNSSSKDLTVESNESLELKTNTLPPLLDEKKFWPRFLALNMIKKVPLRDPCNNKTLICAGELMECRHGYCKCQEDFVPRPDNPDQCGERILYNIEIPQTDPTMIGVVIGLCCMSVTMCIILRLFAKARFQENRTIFNTPNPRLMNVSLFKGPKKLVFHNSRSSGRRGSSSSVNNGDPAAFEQQQAITRRDFEERFLKSEGTEASRQPQQPETYPQNQPSTSRQAAATAAAASSSVVVNEVSKFTKFKQQDSVTSSTTV